MGNAIFEEINELERTYSLASSILPIDLKIEPFDEIQTTSKNSIELKTSNFGKQDRRENKNRESRKTVDPIEEYVCVKNLKNNIFLSIVLKSKKHESWLEDLRVRVRKARANMQFDSEALRITPIQGRRIDESARRWVLRINGVLSEFFSHFRMEKISYDDELKTRIDQDVRVAYAFGDNQTLAVLGKIYDFSEFLVDNPQFVVLFKHSTASTVAQLVAKTEVIAPQINIIKDTSRHERISASVYVSNSGLINKLVKFIKKNYELTSCFIDDEINPIDVDFRGSHENVNKAAELFQKALDQIRTRAITQLDSLNILKAQNLASILNDCLRDHSHVLYDLKVSETNPQS